MANYILPDGFDFESALNQADDEGSDQSDFCLISHEPLCSPFVTLSCGHRFNYCPLYNEVLEQKKTRSEGGNSLETTRLFSNQMKCPYCRNVENHVLPYFPGLGVPKTSYVNAPRKWALLPSKCEYIMKSGKRKGEACGKPSHGSLCDKHMDRTSNSSKALSCVALLASGARKGEPCGAKASFCSMADGTSMVLCKRHNKMLTKQA
jgi:hypothetical protein